MLTMFKEMSGQIDSKIERKFYMETQKKNAATVFLQQQLEHTDNRQ